MGNIIVISFFWVQICKVLYFAKRSWQLTILAMQVFTILLLLIKIYDYCFHISHLVNIKIIIFHANCRQWMDMDMDVDVDIILDMVRESSFRLFVIEIR